MTAVGTLAWNDGVLMTSSSNGPVRAWRRAADLAAARLAVEPPVASLELADGRDLLAAAFAVFPFARAPWPRPVFGAGVTPAARTAFAALADDAAGALRVLRGEPDEFILFARATRDGWQVGAVTSEPLVLTVRVEDLWRSPAQVRPPCSSFCVKVVRDANAKDAADAQTDGVVQEALADVAPDARIFLELARGGGFLLTVRMEGM